MTPRLVIATHNDGKLKEISALFSGLSLRLVSASDAEIPEPIETGASFIENAELKARYAAAHSGLPSLADDCGMSVSALGGEPGVYSKRFAMHAGSWEAAIQQLIHRLQGLPSTASFHCGLALAWPDGRMVSVEAAIEGRVVSPRGVFGAGFDPCFLPLSFSKTYGEMLPEQRDTINHRALAFRKLTEKVDWGCLVLKPLEQSSY